MEPANPPFPTPWNLWFQPEAGSQASKRIFESAEGVIIPATRQNAGRLSIALSPGGVNDPAGTAWAAVIFVSGSVSAARLSHATGDRAAANAAMQMSRAMIRIS
jgi:hypothetical protein